ncbi:contactin-2-like [Haliotis rufescens]|uniref:contactin-2-like n=1 Tax=Haliotis rufescens TaxID=6454 RepID=UPI00201F175D|nr:contactin-2-like [Haliotis rufescens]XP_048241061.1 contactin-2-like [Haliotis rufescens]
MTILSLIFICTCLLPVSISGLQRASIDTGSFSCRPYKVVEGQQNVRFTCHATSSNETVTSYIWRRNGIPSVTGRVLDLSPVTRSRGGSYTCLGRNARGTHVSEAALPVTLDVQYGVTVQVKRSTSVTESQTLDVACSVDSHPVATVKWTKKNDAKLTSQTGSTLTITNIQRSQSGTYVCTATNTLSPCFGTSVVRSDSAEVKVDVQYKPQILTLSINHATNRVTVTEHDSITLMCSVDSNPLSTVKLMKGTKELTAAFNSQTVEYKWTADCRHGGIYSCAAENSIDEPARRHLELFVGCLPRPDDMSSLNRKYVSSHGGNVILSMTILSYPRPSIVWTRPEGHNQNNLTSREISTSAVTVTSTLQLRNLQPEDFGMYQLHANNALGQIVETFTLVSQGPPLAPTDVTVSVKDSASLHISWKQEFNGGSAQIFTVEYSKDNEHWDEARSYLETGRGKDLQAVLSNLESDTIYHVRIITGNIYGHSMYTVSVQGRTESRLKDPVVIVCMIIGVLIVIAVAVIIVLSTKSRACAEESKNEGQSHSGVIQNNQDSGIYSGLRDKECDRQIYTVLKSFAKSSTEGNAVYEGLQVRSPQVYEDIKTSITTETNTGDLDLHVYEN